MYTTLCLLVGFVLGFATNYGNCKRSLKVSLVSGLMSGSALGAICLLGYGGGWVLALACLTTTVAGSIVAVYTPDLDPIKRKLERHFKQ